MAIKFGFNKFWNIKPSDTDGKIVDLFVYDAIVSKKKDAGFFAPESEDVVSTEFIKDLKRYPAAEEIHVHINSPGGEVFAALGMMNQLIKHPAKVITYNDGITASAATLLFGVGDERIANLGSIFMYHNVIGSMQGNKHEIQKHLEVMSKVEESILDLYENSSNLSREELQSLMDKETYLTANEAVEMGFASVVKKKEDEEDEEKMLVAVDEASGFCMSNGLSFKLTAFGDLDALKSKLLNKKKNMKGEHTMDYNAFFASLTPENQALITNQITTSVSAATAPLQASLTAAEKEIKTLVGGSVGAKTGVDVTNLLNGELTADLSSEAKAQIEAVIKAAQESQKQLEMIQEEQKFQSFCNELKDLDKLPLDDKTQKALYALANTSQENYAQVKSLLAVANTAMEDNFRAVGSDAGKTTGSTAFDQMESKISAMRKENDKLAYNDAMQAVIVADPALWDAYRNEQYGN